MVKEKKLNAYRLIRISRDLTIQEVADRVGKSKSYVSEIENDVRIPREGYDELFAEKLNVSTALISMIQKDKKSTYEQLLCKILKIICKEKWL